MRSLAIAAVLALPSLAAQAQGAPPPPGAETQRCRVRGVGAGNQLRAVGGQA